MRSASTARHTFTWRTSGARRATGERNICRHAGHATAGLGMVPVPLAQVAVD